MSELYRVKLDAFEGPMDLLLYLIRKHEVDLHDIPVSNITSQYISFLDDIESIDIELAGEFLVTAATLMELKSRVLAQDVQNKDASEEDDEQRERDDPRAELVRQLLEYKKYRDAADALEDRMNDWARRAPVKVSSVDSALVRDALDEMGELEIEDLDLTDLVDAFKLIVESVNFDRLGEHAVVSDDTPIEVHASDILETLRSSSSDGSTQTPSTLRTIMSGKTRPEMIGRFLALLVLVRDQRVTFETQDSEIVLGLGQEQGDEPSDQPIADFV